MSCTQCDGIKHTFDEAEAQDHIDSAHAETGLPAADPIREGPSGADRIAGALREGVPA